jgi:hypothetical protein
MFGPMVSAANNPIREGGYANGRKRIGGSFSRACPGLYIANSC